MMAEPRPLKISSEVALREYILRKLNLNSLIMTIFGDIVLPRGGIIWLAALVKLLEPLGFTENLVRICMFRLTKAKWFVSHKIGQKSYYYLDEARRDEFYRAYDIVYKNKVMTHIDMNETFAFVFTWKLSSKEKKTFERIALKNGSIKISSDIFIYHSHELVLLQQSFSQNLILCEAKLSTKKDMQLMRSCIKENVHIKKQIKEYYDFIDFFRPILRYVAEEKYSSSKVLKFMVRVISLDAYRRLVLAAVKLPPKLLPSEWPDRLCRNLLINIYDSVKIESDLAIQKLVETDDAFLPGDFSNIGFSNSKSLAAELSLHAMRPSSLPAKRNYKQ